MDIPAHTHNVRCTCKIQRNQKREKDKEGDKMIKEKKRRWGKSVIEEKKNRRMNIQIRRRGNLRIEGEYSIRRTERA